MYKSILKIIIINIKMNFYNLFNLKIRNEIISKYFTFINNKKKNKK